VFVRHGESEWNKLNLFCGWHDVNLSEEGKSSRCSNLLIIFAINFLVFSFASATLIMYVISVQRDVCFCEVFLVV
jgi:bisphosphoglycerate-dependent phosphoglycerate mutase